MSFLTQVRQVLQRDMRGARWALIAFVATLGYAVVQGRQLLEPLPLNESFRVPADSSVAAVATTAMVTFALAGFVALAFVPRVAPAERTNQTWHTLPIEPSAVWLARMLWVLASFTLALAVAWLVLLPLPISAMSRLQIAASVSLNTATIMLAGAVMASVAASLRTFFGVMLLTPVLLFVVPVLSLLLPGPSDGSMLSVDIGFDHGALSISTVHVVALLALSAVTLFTLLRARRVGWLGRMGAGLVALMLLAANVMRVPAPASADVSESLPTLVAVHTVSALLEQPSRTGTIVALSDGAGTTVDSLRVNAARRARTADTEETPSHYLLRLDPRLTSLAANDRLVMRPRAATLRSGSDTWRFSAVGSDVVVAPGDPLLGAQLRWLNAPPPGIQLAYASAVRRPSEVPALLGATASFTLDVIRQQPVMLADVPLDGSPTTGPWRRFVRAELTAPTDTVHTVRVSLKRLSGTHAPRRPGDVVSGEFTYALRHRDRGEVLHLTMRAQHMSALQGWALSPSLLDAVHGSLQPAGVLHTSVRDFVDAEWLRGASLVVIGWRTVERGALTLEAPLSTSVAAR